MCIVGAAPFAALGFFTYHGMTAEQFIWAWSANGQITVPAEIRRLLGLKSGDKILFFQNQGGEVVLS